MRTAMKAMSVAMICLSLVACSTENMSAEARAEIPQAESARLNDALKHFGSNPAEFQRFLSTGDETWLQKVLTQSRQDYTGYTEIRALRQITAAMAQDNASPERFMQVCLGTDFLVIADEAYVYGYDQWHTAVCNRGATVAASAEPAR
jgi:hypothetical protein